ILILMSIQAGNRSTAFPGLPLTLRVRQRIAGYEVPANCDFRFKQDFIADLDGDGGLAIDADEMRTGRSQATGKGLGATDEQHITADPGGRVCKESETARVIAKHQNCRAGPQRLGET